MKEKQVEVRGGIRIGRNHHEAEAKAKVKARTKVITNDNKKAITSKNNYFSE